MKRIFALFLLMCVIATSCSPLGKEKNKQTDQGLKAIDLSYASNLYDFAFTKSGDEFYVADGKEIFIADMEGKKQSVFADSLNNCTNVAVDSYTIYAFDKGENGSSIKVFDIKGKFTKEIPLQIESINKMEYVEGYLLISFSSNDSDKYRKELMVFNLKDNSSFILEYSNVQAFTPYIGSTVLINLTSGPSNFIIYDYLKQEKVSEFNCNVFCMDLFFNKDENCIYYLGSSLGKINKENNTAETVVQLDNIVGSKLVLSDDSCYFLDRKNKKLCSAYAKSLDPKKQITIISRQTLEMRTLFKNASSSFCSKHPGCTVVFKTMDMNQIKTALMAGDTSMDIIHADYNLINEYAETGAIINLDGYSDIKSKFSNMFDGLENICKYKNKLIGVPYIVGVDCWEVNPELLSKLNLDLPPEDWTWLDLYDYAKKARRDLNKDGKNETYVTEFSSKKLPAFINQYNCMNFDPASKKASYNTEEFKKLLAFWKKIIDEDLVSINLPTSYKMDDRILFKQQGNTFTSGDRFLIYPPILPSQRVYSAQASIFGISSNSEKQDLAIDFLSTYMSTEVQTSEQLSSNIILKDISLYPPPDERRKVKISNVKNQEIYANLLKYSSREPFHVDFRTYITEVMDSYLSNNISVDKAAEMIDQKAKMIAGE